MRTTKIAVFTGTRAEYGILYWLLKDIESAKDLKLQLLVSGSHLSPEFGRTVELIETDGFEIAEKIEMLLSSDSAVGTVKSLGLGIIGYADALARQQPDVIVILGDRYEALGIAQAAMLMRIPILHIHGGEITEGVYDDAIRHAISKLSLLHATAAEPYRQRVIQLGESPERVFNTGALGLDHIRRSTLMTREELGKSLNFSLRKEFFILTYHPVTLAGESAEETYRNILLALEDYPDFNVILTYPNADEGGRKVVPLIEDFALKNQHRVLAVPSLGQIRYLSALKYTTAVIGNSSSGIIEAPSFKIPTVNIGQRQKGRLAAKSVIHCEPSLNEIKLAIKTAIQDKKQMKNVRNPYGEGNASRDILAILKQSKLADMKKFHDIRTTDDSHNS